MRFTTRPGSKRQIPPLGNGPSWPTFVRCQVTPGSCRITLSGGRSGARANRSRGSGMWFSLDAPCRTPLTEVFERTALHHDGARAKHCRVRIDERDQVEQTAVAGQAGQVDVDDVERE